MQGGESMALGQGGLHKAPHRRTHDLPLTAKKDQNPSYILMDQTGPHDTQYFKDWHEVFQLKFYRRLYPQPQPLFPAQMEYLHTAVFRQVSVFCTKNM